MLQEVTELQIDGVVYKLTQLHCPGVGCGLRRVWEADDWGDHHEDNTNICTGCGFVFRIQDVAKTGAGLRKYPAALELLRKIEQQL